jgi:hypothetical protein
MLKKWFLSFPVILILAAYAFTGKASAASLYFAVPTEVVNVSISEQGTMAIDYLIDFDNSKGGAVIDFVDIGLPNQNYNLSSITADVDGKAITNIQKGDPQYIPIGVTLGLGSNAIQPGQKGRLHLFVGEVRQMLYPYTGDNKTGFVSFEFGPSTFGAQYLLGSTDFTLSLHLPKGVTPDEPVYFPASNGWPGNTTPEGTLDSNGLVTYTWHSATADAYTQYKFGSAFPAKYIPASAIVQPVNQTNTNAIPISKIIEILFLGVIVFVIIVALIMMLTGREKKMTYLPPKIAIEGLGIKRGLTSVEVAVLMELPVDKILTMILFSVIKKGAASIAIRDPLKLEVILPLPPDLHYYESNFLNAFTDVGLDIDILQSLLINLMNNVRFSMQGFSRKETVAYYQDIIAKAWAEVETAGTPEVKSQKFDETMDWTQLDSNFDSRITNTFKEMPVIAPVWWGRYDPAFKRQVSGAVSVLFNTTSGPVAAPGLAVPHLPGSDFAASIINSTSDFSTKTIKNVQAFTASIANKVAPPQSPYIPIPPASRSSNNSFWSSLSPNSSSWSSGGSHHSVHISTHSGGGHHCACACAGGGR